MQTKSKKTAKRSVSTSQEYLSDSEGRTGEQNRRGASGNIQPDITYSFTNVGLAIKANPLVYNLTGDYHHFFRDADVQNAAQNLYECIGAHPEFTDKKWDESTSFAEVHSYLISEVVRITRKSNCIIDEEGHVTAYAVGNYCYSGHIPLSFIEDLQGEFKELMFDCLHKFNATCEFHDVIEYGMIFNIVESMEEQLEYHKQDNNDEGVRDIEHAMDLYSDGGLGHTMLVNINKPSTKSLKTLVRRVKRFKPEGEVQQKCHAWMKSMMDYLSNDPISLSIYNFNPDDPNQEQGTPLLPCNSIYFTYMPEGHGDYLTEELSAWDESSRNEIGEVPFVEYEIWGNGKYNEAQMTDAPARFNKIVKETYDLINETFYGD